MQNIIGKSDCVGCGELVPVKAQKNGHVHTSCAWCGLLVQSHSARADTFIKGRMKGVSEAEARELAGDQQARPAPATAGSEKDTSKAKRGAKPAPAAKPAAKPAEEKTIFDFLKG